MLVFICSPYAGDIEKNVIRARKYCERAINEGHCPFAPHLFFPQILDENNESERNLGIRLGLEWLRQCNELWLFGWQDGITSGMQREIDEAIAHGLPIVYKI